MDRAIKIKYKGRYNGELSENIIKFCMFSFFKYLKYEKSKLHVHTGAHSKYTFDIDSIIEISFEKMPDY